MVQMLIFFIQRFYVRLIKILERIFVGFSKLVLEYIWKFKGLEQLRYC